MIYYNRDRLTAEAARRLPAVTAEWPAGLAESVTMRLRTAGVRPWMLLGSWEEKAVWVYQNGGWLAAFAAVDAVVVHSGMDGERVPQYTLLADGQTGRERLVPVFDVLEELEVEAARFAAREAWAERAAARDAKTTEPATAGGGR